MFDVHCHLNFHSYKDDFDQVITNAKVAGVTSIINVGTKIDSSEKAVELAKKYDNLYAIVGVHPHHADKIEEDEHWLSKLEALAAHPANKVVAIGEIGMDFYRYKSNGIVEPELQEKIFIKQIELAYRLELPLQIHNRHAGAEILEILKAHKDLLLPQPGMFHCFAGDMAVLEGVLDLGFCVGFDGNITYKGLSPGESMTLSDLAKATPLDRIVTETDSPFLTPEPHRGTRNQPAYAILIGQHIANLKGISFEDLVTQTTSNAKRIFRLA